jgi:transposase
MMGRRASAQDRLFYSFNLEDHIPDNHLLRRIDQCLDFSGLHEHMAEHYSQIGRPSVDPELMMRMLVVGYCYGIRSERRLCEELHLNLAYRWFCRLSLDESVPNHSTFSKNRHGRFRDSNVLRWFFDEVLRRCMAAGLVKGEGFAVDASIVAADASPQHAVDRDQAVDWKDPALSTRAVREYLQALDANELSDVLPKKVSLTDPLASWTAATGGPAFYAYSTNYVIDVEHGVILDLQATSVSRTAEAASTIEMVERIQQQLGLKPKRLIGDTSYGTAPMLGWMVEQGIEPHVPVWDRTQREDGTYSSTDFVWDEQANEYRCPQGKPLRSQWRTFTIERSHITKAGTIIYRSSKQDCSDCPMKQHCSPNTPTRKIARSVHEAARDVARQIATTEQYQRSRCERKKVEMLFAHLKRILRLDRLRLRGMSGARDEFTMAAAVQNLRRLAKLVQQGPPLQGAGASS